MKSNVETKSELDEVHALLSKVEDTDNIESRENDIWVTDLLVILDDYLINELTQFYIRESTPDLEGASSELNLQLIQHVLQHFLSDTSAPKSIYSTTWLKQVPCITVKRIDVSLNMRSFKFAGTVVKPL